MHRQVSKCTHILWSTPDELLPDPILDVLGDLHWEPMLQKTDEPAASGDGPTIQDEEFDDKRNGA